MASEPHSGRTASFTGGGSQLILPGTTPPSRRHRLSSTTYRPPWPATRTADAAQLSASSINTTGTVRRDGAQPPLSPVYDGPYRVLEWSTYFFLLEMGERTDKMPTLRLKAARTPADTEPAKPPRRGHPVVQAPPVHALPPTHRGRPRQVTFNLPPTAPPTTSSTSASGCPLRNARPPGGPVVAYCLFPLRFPP